MVIADNKVNSQAYGVFYFINSFYTAVERYNQFEILCFGKVNALNGDTIPFVVTVGYVKIDI